MNLIEATQSGNRRDMLIALREKLAQEIEQSTSGRDLAALSRQYTEVLTLIEEMPDEVHNKADEIAAKRKARLSKDA